METANRQREVILPATASLSPGSSWLECAGARLCRRAAGSVTVRLREGRSCERVEAGTSLRKTGFPWTPSLSSHSDKHFFFFFTGPSCLHGVTPLQRSFSWPPDQVFPHPSSPISIKLYFFFFSLMIWELLGDPYLSVKPGLLPVRSISIH